MIKLALHSVHPSSICADKGRHHIALPGATTTPKCGYYEAATLQIAPDKHHLVAQSMEKYANAIGEKIFNYLAVAVSNEDPGTLVLIMGYPDAHAAEIADKVCAPRAH